MLRICTLFVMMLFLMSSCVSKKKMAEIQAMQDQLKRDHDNTLIEFDLYRKQCEEDKLALRNKENESQTKNKYLQETIAEREKQNKNLQNEIDYQKKTNTNLLDRLSDLSIVSKEGAASIKNSLETLNRQSGYIQDLTGTIQRKDSVNLSLVMNLKRSLSDINDQDVNVEVKKGVVYVSLSDKLLYNSGSSVVKPSAEIVLSKIAKVVNDHRNLDILIEGHTDNVPIANSCITDNWDLSVKRATSVARVLQQKYAVDPSRITAGGRSEYSPKASNDNSFNRSINRRTEIIILPKLDEFFELLKAPQG